MSRPAGRFAPRLALAVGALLAAAIGALGLVFAEDLGRELTGDLTRSLLIQARLGARGEALDAKALGAACECRATVIAPDGEVLGDSSLDPAGLSHAENHRARPEVAAALDGREASAVRRSATLGVHHLYAAAPVLAPGGKIRGAVRLSLPLTAVERRVSVARRFVLWMTLAVFAAALTLAWLLARAAGRPLEEMAAVARRLAAGEYGARVRGPLGGDERALLGETLNVLAARVEETIGELSRDKGRLAAVLDQMAEGVVAVDAEGRVLLVNPALSRLLGIDAEQARGRGHLETLRHHGLAELVGEVLRGGAPAARELRLFSPEELVFDAHAALLQQGGRPAGALVVLHDITRLRRLEQVRRDFVANVSHELRTPLSSIKGFAETLREGAVDDKENRLGFLRTIEEQAVQLSQLVDDLLDLSSIESGHRQPTLAPTDLRGLAVDATRRFAPAAAERGVILATFSSSPVNALADAEQVRQVLANLIDNAIKYTEPGGRVEISLETREDQAVVRVRDTGVGIPEADLTRIFERFYRVDKSRSREAGGTGLGLAIVKHLVEAQGGRVWVESRQPGGSAFFFSLRAA
ncbi:MAG: PAS domain-containing protein [Elusimicrobia bacterium]|nr:PAS domain-containing protein [Elusimicrobiota bacterium]